MSFFDRLFFTEAVRLIRIGRQRALDADDASPLLPILDPRKAPTAFDGLPTDRVGPFLLAAYKATGAPARRVLVLTVLRVGFAVATPVLLHSVLAGLPGAAGGPFPVGLLCLALLLGIAGLAGAITAQHWYLNSLKAFGVIVNGMNGRIVRHALRLRRSARSTMQTGDLVNHMSSDADAIAEAAFFLPEFLSSFLSILAVMTALVVYLGWAALAALGALVLIAPLAALVARRFRALDHTIMELRDERVTLMSQILAGIRVVKFHAWERSVGAEVHDVRRRELRTRRQIVVTDALSTALFISTTTIVAFAGFSAYAMLGGTLTAPVIFSCLALFAMLEEPFGMISHLLANLQHARVAVGRLHRFFAAPVRDEGAEATTPPDTAVGLAIHDLTVAYADNGTVAVDGVTLDVGAGAAVAVVGAVGAGKSTLLRAILGVQVPQRGSVELHAPFHGGRARTAWVPQDAFILNASVEDNIRFGLDDEAPQRLTSILADTALTSDLAAMPAGLATEIGERGVNLSGGQKQRVSLARAAWQRPGVVVLDDPLSAVDVHTEDVLVDRLLFGRWGSVTRIVATHRLAHLHRFDTVVFMVDGRVAAVGPHERLMRDHAGYRAFVTTEGEHTPTPARAGTAPVTPPAAPVGTAGADASRITDDEDRAVGAVRWSVFVDYLRAMIGRHPVLAPLTSLALVGTAAAITAMPMLQTRWLGQWTDNPGSLSPLQAVMIYGALGIVVLSGWLLERFLWLYRSVAAGRTIHDAALRGVLAAPLRFFDSTPMGRILNRFARDTEAVDDHLTWNFEQSFKSLSQTIGALVLIVSVMPLVLLVIVPVLAVYYRLQRDYRQSAREAKRIESMARSPRYAQFKELVTGLDVIHGFGRERFFLDTFHDILGAYQRAFWTSIMLNRWFSIRVPLVSGLVALVTCSGIVVMAHHQTVTAGTAGFVLMYALSFWMSLNWTVRSFSEVESRMTAVERLLHYARLSAEPDVHGTALAPTAVWPTAGHLDIRGLSVRYADHLPMVLHDVSIAVPGGAKVGVIGRTGSGKSTLFQTLFRFIEPTAGTIAIDGVDIATIPLERLRRAIAIIPQDPTLFIGTIRSNLDRFGEADDAAIHDALRRVQLFDQVMALPGGLDAVVQENGMNFSQGQRQLLCMARAILTRARVIVLDEATASVDVQTDALIQRTVRTEFADVTVLVIAHRLHTVADADMVVELAAGRVVAITERHGQ